MFEKLMRLLIGKESLAVREISDFVGIVQHAISFLDLQLASAAANDTEVSSAHFIACTAYSDRSTDARIELIRELSAGAFYAGIGELLISLVDEMRRAADAAKRAARVINLLSQADAGVTLLRENLEKLKEMVRLGVRAVGDISDAVTLLLRDRNLALATALHTNELEEEADSVKQTLGDKLAEIEQRYGSRVAREFNFLLVSLDEVVDRSGDASVHVAKVISRSGQ